MLGECAKPYIRPKTHKNWTVESSHSERVSVQRIASVGRNCIVVKRICEGMRSRLTSGLLARNTECMSTKLSAEGDC
jgi:hypothetical protein